MEEKHLYLLDISDPSNVIIRQWTSKHAPSGLNRHEIVVKSNNTDDIYMEAKKSYPHANITFEDDF